MADAQTPSSASFDRDPIEQLADSFIARFRAGEHPSIEDYAAKYPDQADDIRELLPALVELELNHSPMGSVTASVGQTSTAGAAEAPRQLGDYLILREIGRGGMGVVYEAVQQSLGRHVALKVMPQNSLAGSSHLERFRLEARAAARLHHTNIVPVFGVGEQEGVHYYAMQFIQGQGLDEVFEELRRLRDGRSQKGKSTPAGQSQASQSGTARALTLAATHGLLTGRFKAGKENEVEIGEETQGSDAPSLGTTQAETTGAEPSRPPSGNSHGSAVSTHSELADTQNETRYYRSVARVGLQVAEALAYAHSQGILHRDIKPSNLLLDAKGTIWVTDFGLAKAEGTDALTHTGDIVGTLRYMAPERFDGWSDPRSDVYALGVTLYELLTLQYLFTEGNRVKLIDRVVHEVPTSPRKLDKSIPRDLETIVLKAVAKEPAQRYVSAEQMAEDLQRFLADKPVLARRTSATEQAWRWCRRNPALAGASMLALTGLVAAVVVLATSNARIARTSRDLALALRDKDGALQAARDSEAAAKTSAAEADRQMIRAEAGEAQARSAVDDFLNKVTEDQLLKAPGLQNLRRDLLRSALRFYDGFLKDRGDDPNLQAAQAEVHLRVGQILSDLGERPAAQRSYLAAKKLYQALATMKPEEWAYQDGLANCKFRTGDNVGAIAIWEKRLQANSANPRDRNSLADAYNSLAIAQGNESKIGEELQSHQKARALREDLVRDFPDEPEYHNALSATLNNIGVLLNQQGHTLDALAMYQRAIEHGEAAFSMTPQSLMYGRFLGTSYSNVAGTLSNLGRHDEAERWYRKTQEHWRRLSRDNPAVPDFHSWLYKTSNDLGRFLIKQGRKAESEEPFRQAAQALRDLPRSTPGDLYNLACVQARVSAAIGEGGGKPSVEEKSEAGSMANAAIETLRKAFDGGCTVSAEHVRNDADLEILRGRPDFQDIVSHLKAAEEAAAMAKRGDSAAPRDKLKVHQEALAARAKLASEDPKSRRFRADQAASQHSIGRILTDLGRHEEGEKMLRESLAAHEQLVREDPKSVRYRLDIGHNHLGLGAAYWATERLAEADREWKLAVKLMETTLRDESADSGLGHELDNALIEIADKQFKLGLWEEAGELMNQVFHRNPSSQAVSDGHFWHIQAALRVLAGDLAGYRESCAEFFKQFRNSDNKFNLYRASLAGPDSLPAADLAALVALAEKEVERQNSGWNYLFAGTLHMRSNHFAKALEIFESGQPEPAIGSEKFPVRAIILHRLGRHEEAKKALAEADRGIEEEYLGVLNRTSFSPIPYPEVLVLREVLRHEAHALIEGKPVQSDPYRMLVRARVLAKMGREKDAESAFAAAAKARDEDPKFMITYARLLGELGRKSESQSIRTRALVLFEKAVASKPDSADLLRARGELFASQGDWDKAAPDLARAFAVAKDAKPRWCVAGTWIVGPYPFGESTHEADRQRAEPPEKDPDPGRPVTGPDGKATLTWRPVTLSSDQGFLDLTPLIQPGNMASTYVLAKVYSPEARAAVALVNNDDWLRLWCNGKFVLAQPLQLDTLTPVVVQLRAGWNSIVAKVSNWESGQFLRLKLTDDAGEIARAYGRYVDQQGWNDQTAALLDRLYAYFPKGLAAWQPRSFLDAEVVSRGPLFQKILDRRLKDTQLWIARGRHLAWQGRWDDALAAYDKAIHTHPALDDADAEYACILLLKGDRPAYLKWCGKLSGKVGLTDPEFAGYLQARIGTMAPKAVHDPARLVRWAEQGAGADHTPWDDHTLGLAHLRAGQLDLAAGDFERSIKADPNWPGGKPILNWLGLALARQQQGQAAARGWLEKAEEWFKDKEPMSADRSANPLPPIYINDWLEALVLFREASALVGKSRLADLLLADQSLPTGQSLQLPLGPVSFLRDRAAVTSPGAFRLVAPFRTKSPIADGRISPEEYGPRLTIDFTDDINPGRSAFGPKNPARDADDLSAELSLAYTKTDLFVAVRVRDDVLITAEDRNPEYRDRVELFFDGDRQPGDLLPTKPGGSAEGFQVCCDALGRKASTGLGTSDDDYAVATSTFKGGYLVEFRIPLKNIDTDDGAEASPAGPGATLRFNLAIVDNDEPVDAFQRYAQLWHVDGAPSAYMGGDGPHWPVDLHLARPVKYEFVDSPKSATIDPDTGLFAWDTPEGPGTTKITVRVRDAGKPELTDEASFLVATTPPKK